MQIFCPKCATGYEINDDLLKEKSRKLKCGNCGEIFVVDKIPAEDEEKENSFEQLSAAMESESEDAPITQNDEAEAPKESLTEEKLSIEDEDSKTSFELKEENVAEDVEDKAEETQSSVDEAGTGDSEKTASDDEENVDIEDIFERLSERTENLINDEKKLPLLQRIRFWFKNLFGLAFGIKWRYIIIGTVIVCVILLFNNRYDIVRKIPVANEVFKAFGITAKIPGEGLEFQNISWDMAVKEEGNQLEIRGFIFNQTQRKIRIPTIHVEILDKETSMLQSQNITLENPEVDAQDKVALSINIPQAAPTMKYVYLTFIEID